MKSRLPEREFVLVGFIDPGGSLDDYFLTLTRVVPRQLKIYVIGAMHWRLNEQAGVDFAKIRNDIAKLHMQNHFNLLGCELNNYGRAEVLQMRREYHIKMIGVNTAAKVTSETVIRKGKTMDKHQMIRWLNSWRQQGRIVFPKTRTPELQKIINQVENYVVKRQPMSGRYIYEADEGNKQSGERHDDGVASLLGNLFIVKEKIFRISGYDFRASGAKEYRTDIENSEKIVLPHRAMGAVKAESYYQGI